MQNMIHTVRSSTCRSAIYSFALYKMVLGCRHCGGRAWRSAARCNICCPVPTGGISPLPSGPGACCRSCGALPSMG